VRHVRFLLERERWSLLIGDCGATSFDVVDALPMQSEDKCGTDRSGASSATLGAFRRTTVLTTRPKIQGLFLVFAAIGPDAASWCRAGIEV
jgi:hypothetical protein